jgi:hypothetical protein
VRSAPHDEQNSFSQAKRRAERHPKTPCRRGLDTDVLEDVPGIRARWARRTQRRTHRPPQRMSTTTSSRTARTMSRTASATSRLNGIRCEQNGEAKRRGEQKGAPEKKLLPRDPRHVHYLRGVCPRRATRRAERLAERRAKRRPRQAE